MDNNSDRKHKIKIQPFLLLLAAFIWGIAFVAQSEGADSVPPFTFNAIRSLLAVVVLTPLVIVRRKARARYGYTDEYGYMNHIEPADASGNVTKSRDVTISGDVIKSGMRLVKDGKFGDDMPDSGTRSRISPMTKKLIVASIVCGLLLSAATFIQQYAIQYVETGKCGFLTALYIVLVPVILMFRGKMPGKNVAFGVMIAVIGLYFLCITKGSPVSIYDIILILCALLFAFQIISIDHFSTGDEECQNNPDKASKAVRGVDGIELSLGQFIICMLSSVVCMVIFEHPDIAGIRAAALPLLYAGIMSSGAAYTLQIVGMKGMNPTAASLLMSMESVFSVLAGWLIQGQHLSGRELFGCVLMFSAIVLVQLPTKRSKAENLSADT